MDRPGNPSREAEGSPGGVVPYRLSPERSDPGLIPARGGPFAACPPLYLP